jgi:hypothetical protein
MMGATAGATEGATMGATMRGWSRRRWGAAALIAVGSYLALGVPTAVVPNPVFGRGIEPTWWSLPVLVVTSVLVGLLLATYVREPDPAAVGAGEAASAAGRSLALDELPPESTRRLSVGGLLSFLAIGCPTCNKLVLIALGSSGAVTWFAPIQPVLAVGGIVLLAWTLRRRLRSEVACAVR